MTSPSGRLAGKVAMVTGASSGIGKACIERFSAESATVIAVDIAKPVTEGLMGPLSSYACDVTNSDSIKEVISNISSEYGALHIVVNSAGVSARNALSDTTDIERIWDRVIEVNLKGTFLTSMHSVPEIEKSGGGAIINLASTMGIVGYPTGLRNGYSAYPPSKGGVVQFTKTLAVDLADRGIRVNCLCPGFVETSLTESLTSDDETNNYLKGLHPMGRLGRPDEIANAALFLASDESSFITGSSLVIDGGYTAQ